MEDIQPQEGAREFGLSSWSVTNRTTVFVLMAIIIISGLYSYITVPKESFPEVVIPEIYIGTPYPGNSPTNIEKLIHAPSRRRSTQSRAWTKFLRRPSKATVPLTSSLISM